MLIIPKQKKKKYTVLEFGKLEYCRNKIFCILFIKGTRAWYTRVLCCMVLEFTKLKYHIIFFNRTNSNSAVPRWQNWWGTRVSETRVLEKVVICHLFPKQFFFAKNFQKRWYLAILAMFYLLGNSRSKRTKWSSRQTVTWRHNWMLSLNNIYPHTRVANVLLQICP